MRNIKVIILQLIIFLFIGTIMAQGEGNRSKKDREDKPRERIQIEAHWERGLNKTDNKGNRHGFWQYYETDSLIINRYYDHGQKTSMYIMYKNMGLATDLSYKEEEEYEWYSNMAEEYRYALLTIGEYKNDQRIGIWYYFRTDGFLRMTTEEFRATDSKLASKELLKDYPKQSLCKTYHDNGIVSSIGIMLWKDYPNSISDKGIKYGIWDYYNREGRFIKQERFVIKASL